MELWTHNYNFIYKTAYKIKSKSTKNIIKRFVFGFLANHKKVKFNWLTYPSFNFPYLFINYCMRQRERVQSSHLFILISLTKHNQGNVDGVAVVHGM